MGTLQVTAKDAPSSKAVTRGVNVLAVSSIAESARESFDDSLAQTRLDAEKSKQTQRRTFTSRKGW